MLRIYPVLLEVIAMLRPVVAQLERTEPDLARQLRRASSSIALNVAEGMYSRGKNRGSRYHTALGSARETMACIEVAVAAGYIASADAAVMERLHQVSGTLVRLLGLGLRA